MQISLIFTQLQKCMKLHSHQRRPRAGTNAGKNAILLFLLRMSSEKSAHTRSMVDTLNFILLFATFVGVRLTDSDFRFNRLTFCTFALVFMFKVCSVYSVVINKHDLFRVLETLCCWGLTIPVSIIYKYDFAYLTMF